MEALPTAPSRISRSSFLVDAPHSEDGAFAVKSAAALAALNGRQCHWRSDRATDTRFSPTAVLRC
jgi:hypothetical protein